MANNFFNKITRNVSADHTLPTYLYSVPTSKKTIVIELDVANRSTSSQTISVMIDDFGSTAMSVDRLQKFFSEHTKVLVGQVDQQSAIAILEE